MDSGIVLLVISSLGLGAFAYVGLRRLLRRRAARYWPSVTGAVSSSKLEIQERGDQPIHVATVTYSYMVGEDIYSGQHLRSFLLHGRAEKWIARYQEGAAIRVRYKADNAGDSVLLENDQDSRRLKRRRS